MFESSITRTIIVSPTMIKDNPCNNGKDVVDIRNNDLKNKNSADHPK
jgi:hypothetical protein